MTAQLRILHIVSSGGMYGKEQVILELMRQHRTMGIHSVLGSLRLPEDAEKEIEARATEEQLAVESFRVKRGFDTRGARSIMAFTERNRISLVHIHDYKGSILLAPSRIRRRVPPLVRTLHGFMTTHRSSKIAIYEWLERQSLRFHDRLIAVSDEMQLPWKSPLQVIKNGISATDLGPGCNSISVQVKDFCSKGTVVGSIARLSREKNLPALVRAFRILVDNGSDARLLLAGDGDRREELEGIIRAEGLENRVLLLGFFPDAHRLLSLCTVYIQPSLTEGTPISILEAMQSDVPLCVTPVGGMRSLINKGAAAEIPFDPIGIADGLDDLLRDPSRRDTLAANAKHLFNSEYSGVVMATAYRDVYRDVLHVSNS